MVTRSKGKLGVEEQHTTLLMFGELTVDFIAIDRWLVPLRMVKTPHELTILRRNFALTDIGHTAARAATMPGKREIDVWLEIYSAISQVAGYPVRLGNDCVVGYRQDNVGGAPQEYLIRPGDSLTVDLSTVDRGYWSDSCMTYYAGERSFRQQQVHDTVRRALELGISLVKPGVAVNSIDRTLREFMARHGLPGYPHHTGHGVGVSGHEEPRITPYNETLLQPGMVIMLEPGAYFPGELSVRIEDGILVTDSGAEVLTTHSKL
ncbi:MAG: aminopeptidase P family protein [Armatimonadetes bacterium]|nr:aminopeptidase P family protein [Anaerolineae bacterium]